LPSGSAKRAIVTISGITVTTHDHFTAKGHSFVQISLGVVNLGVH